MYIINPRTNFEKGDKNTVRAFVTLFKKVGDQFQYHIDGYDDSEEVRAELIIDDYKNDGDSVISITSINEESKLNKIKQTIKDMNLQILDENVEDGFHKKIGDYKSYTIKAKANEQDIKDKSWNVPHLIVYGSLNPEIKKSINVAFGNDVNYDNIRNHFVIYGENINNRSKTEFSDAINNTADLFNDQIQNVRSSVNTADIV